MKIKANNVGEHWASANDLHEMKGTTRAWLRDLWKSCAIRRRSITGRGRNDELKTKYLFCVEDVERELAKTERKGVRDGE